MKDQMIPNKQKQTKSKPIKKIPALHEKCAVNQIYIKGSRPYPVYLKHSYKVLRKHNTIIIHALTSAINKAVKLALQLMKEYPYLRQQIFTDSIPTINENDNGEVEVKQRSAIHIVLRVELREQKEEDLKK